LIYVQLVPSVDGKAIAEVERLLPKVLIDVQEVARDAATLIVTMNDLAADIETNSAGRFRRQTARTSPRCCAGWVTGIFCCSATSVAGARESGHRRRVRGLGCCIAARFSSQVDRR